MTFNYFFVTIIRLVDQLFKLAAFFTQFSESAGEGLFEAIVGALSAVMLLLIVIMVAIIWTNHRRKSLQEALAGKFDSPYGVGSSQTSTATTSATAGVQLSPGAKIDRSMTATESVDDDDDLLLRLFSVARCNGMQETGHRGM